METISQDLKNKTTERGFSEFEDFFCIRHKCKMKGFKFSLFGEKEKTIYSCSPCSEEIQQREYDLRSQQMALEIQKKINSNIANAMISPRFSEKTFLNFRADNVDQEKVLESCIDFVDHMDKSPGLIFTGNPGTGKNHLACAIVKSAITNHYKTALITTAMKMIRAIKSSWNGGNEKEVIRSFILPDVLVIDELGVQFGSETEKLYLTEIINDRYEFMKPTIVLTNLAISKLAEVLGDRVIDRFRDGGKVLVFDWESYRGRDFNQNAI